MVFPHRILLVDENTHVRQLVRRSLVRAGYIVEEATTGLIGLAAFRLAPADLVILNVLMAEENGLATLQALRRLSKSVPILILTAARGNQDDVHIPYPFGTLRVLRTPFGVDELLAVVSHLLWVNAQPRH